MRTKPFLYHILYTYYLLLRHPKFTELHTAQSFTKLTKFLIESVLTLPIFIFGPTSYKLNSQQQHNGPGL